MAESFDFVVLGAGFGGSILSMVLQRLGRSVLLLERGAHPRFVIGESSTPFANLLLEQLSEEFDLPCLRPFAEWGSWQKNHPEISCGLKRGFSFYHHSPQEPLDLMDRSRQLLVAASPNDTVADTHWYRPEFDSFLVDQARKLGVEYLDRFTLDRIEHNAGWRIHGSGRAFFASFAIDATGPGGALANHLGIPATEFATMPRTSAVYAHFRDVQKIYNRAEDSLPYPPDDAALHHVFAEGWIWVLRFNNGLTSAGAALRSPNKESPEATWQTLLTRFPSIARQFAHARPVTGFYSIPQISYRRKSAIGPDCALLPSTAGFIDPLLSTGFALNLLGILRIARMVRRDNLKNLLNYEMLTFRELDAAADLIAALYSKMHSFPEFSALSLLYFAAMSFTETAWRLGQEPQAAQFLLQNDDRFRALQERFCRDALSGREIHPADVAAAIEPWDIAGLGDLSRRNHYPVNFADLIVNRSKLAASSADLERLFAKLGQAGALATSRPLR